MEELTTFEKSLVLRCVQSFRHTGEYVKKVGSVIIEGDALSNSSEKFRLFVSFPLVSGNLPSPISVFNGQFVNSTYFPSMAIEQTSMTYWYDYKLNPDEEVNLRRTKMMVLTALIILLFCYFVTMFVRSLEDIKSQ